ncbi:hypothetical protein VTO42DRAFT_979 [Malbranchea cinnamomea]
MADSKWPNTRLKLHCLDFSLTRWRSLPLTAAATTKINFSSPSPFLGDHVGSLSFSQDAHLVVHGGTITIKSRIPTVADQKTFSPWNFLLIILVVAGLCYSSLTNRLRRDSASGIDASAALIHDGISLIQVLKEMDINASTTCLISASYRAMKIWRRAPLIS